MKPTREPAARSAESSSIVIATNPRAGAYDTRGALDKAAARRVSVALALAAAVMSCAPAANPTASTSRQVVALRDPMPFLGEFTGDEARLYLLSTDSPPYDLSLVDLAGGRISLVRSDAIAIARFLAGGTASAADRVMALFHRAPPAPKNSAAATLSFIDEATGASVDVTNAFLFGALLGATAADPIALDRYDDATGFTISWLGPANALQMAPPGIYGFVQLDASGGIATRSQAEGLSVVHMTFDGLPPVEIVPVQPVAMAPLGGAAGTGADAGAGANAPPGSVVVASTNQGPDHLGYECLTDPGGAAMGRCFLLYTRALADGSLQVFVRFLDDPRELFLPGARNQNDVARGARSLVWLAPAPVSALVGWDADTGRVGLCALADAGSLSLGWSADRTRFAAVVSDKNDRPTQSQLVLGEPGAPCLVMPVAVAMAGPTFSPDGAHVVWISDPATGSLNQPEAVIHLTGVGDGVDRVVATGQFLDAWFLDDRRLAIKFKAIDGTGLSWLDLSVDPVVEHPLGDRIAPHTITRVDARTLLLLTNYLPVDGTYTLGLVDIDSAAETIVARGVVDFSAGPSPATGAGQIPVAYLVRAGVPSPKDGIWLTHVPAAAP